jgi:Ca-activated chloride channel family protein
VVVFLTDGLPTVAEQDPERIAARAEERRGEFRVFSFGIGFDVNAYLLDRLTERARGRTEYISPGGDIERAVGTLTSRIASPVLADLALDGGDGVELYDVQPQALPDLFAGDEVVVFGRYRPAGTGDWALSVRGRRNGAEERFRSGSATAGTLTRDDYIPKLWATRKAGALSREIRLHGQTTELTTALKELALRYGILTEYTSYLVQEPGAVVATGAMSLSAVTVTAAPAPRDQAGAGAVARSQAEAKAAEQAVVVTDGEMVTSALRGRAGINPTRRAGGRLFILRDSVWTDLGHGDSLPVISVAPFSDAYFALLRAVPELRPAAILGQVLVAGRRVSVKIAAGGKEAWRAGELDALVRDFRS